MVRIRGVQLWYMSGVYSCGTYQECTVVACIRGVQLWCVSGVYSCGTYQGCTVVVRIRGVKLWCVSGVYSCGVYQECIIVCIGCTVVVCIRDVIHFLQYCFLSDHFLRVNRHQFI